MDEKKNDLDLSPVDCLTKCLAQGSIESAIAMHERYFLHHYARCDKPLAEAKGKIDALKAEIVKIEAGVAKARHDKMVLSLADPSDREAIERHFAQRKAA